MYEFGKSREDYLAGAIDYKNILEQIDKTNPITFVEPVNVLLIADRLYGCSSGLKLYMENSTNITVDLVDDSDSAISIMQQKHIHYFIIVGYLKNENNYKALAFYKENFQSIHPFCFDIIYARLDMLIRDLGIEHDISYVYERDLPVKDFIQYMGSRYRARQMIVKHEAWKPNPVVKKVLDDKPVNEKKNLLDQIIAWFNSSWPTVW